VFPIVILLRTALPPPDAGSALTVLDVMGHESFQDILIGVEAFPGGIGYGNKILGDETLEADRPGCCQGECRGNRGCAYGVRDRPSLGRKSEKVDYRFGG
jgi:hypothetical protein